MIKTFVKTMSFLFIAYSVSLSAETYKLNKADIAILKKSKQWLNGKQTGNIGNNGIINFKYGVSMPTVFCKPFNATSIKLEEGETVQNFKSGDSERWFLDTVIRGKGTSSKTTYVLIKPLKSGLETNLFIFTNKRIYNIRLVSKQSLWTPFIGFTYDSVAKKPKVKPKVKKISEYSIKSNDNWENTSIYTKKGKTYIKVKKDLDNYKLFVTNKNKSKTITYVLKDGYFIVDTIIQRAILVKNSIFKEIIRIRRNK